MGFLAGKRALIVGLATERSIANGIATAMRREGAELACTYQNDRLKDRVTEMAQGFRRRARAAHGRRAGRRDRRGLPAIGEAWGSLDVIVHSVAFAPREQLAGGYLDSVTREGFLIAHDISSYSLAALAEGGAPADGRAPRRNSDAHLPGRGALDSELQRHGSRQGEPRGERPFPRGGPGARRDARQRHLGGTDQDTGGGGRRAASARC